MKTWVKRLVIIISVMVVSVCCSILIDRAIYRYDGHYELLFSGDPVFLDGSEVLYIEDCILEDNRLTVTGGDPRFAVNGSGKEISTIRLTFSEPVPEDVSIQVFFEMAGEGMSEKNSRYATIEAGTTEERIRVPQAIYSVFRFDIEKNVCLQSIYAGTEEKQYMPYKPHGFRLFVFFCVIFIPACICLFKLIRRRKLKVISEGGKDKC